MDWISINEKSPKENERVLVQNTLHFGVNRKLSSVTIGHLVGAEFYDDHDYVVINVVYWMSLPKPLSED